MHGQNHIKFVCAKQAKTIHEYGRFQSWIRQGNNIHLYFFQRMLLQW